MRKTEQKGITLIALVITIIVLLILAGVSISMLAGDNGILRKAADAKTKTDESSLNEEIQLAYLAALTDGKGKVNYDVLNSELEKLGFDRGTQSEDGKYPNDIKGLPTMIEIKGKEYTISNGGKSGNSGTWVYKKDAEGRKTIITNGVIELKIGDYINYNPADTTEGEDKTKYTSPTGSYSPSTFTIPAERTIWQGSGNSTKQEFDGKAYTGKWKVLGVNEKKGEILIVSADTVKTTDNKNFYLKGFTGVQFGEIELDNICKTFGYGKGASGARSIDVDDVNKITGYNPNNIGVYDAEQTGIGTKYNSGKINEYGNIVTYKWSTTADHADVVGTNLQTGTWSTAYKYGFNWYDEANGKWKNSKQDITNPTEITKLTSSYYMYYATTLTDSSSGTTVGIDKNSSEYKTIFLDDTGAVELYYWLASKCFNVLEQRSYYGDVLNQIDVYKFRVVSGDGAIGRTWPIYSTHGGMSGDDKSVRPVVSLKSDIKLQYDNTNKCYDIK